MNATAGYMDLGLLIIMLIATLYGLLKLLCGSYEPRPALSDATAPELPAGQPLAHAGLTPLQAAILADVAARIAADEAIPLFPSPASFAFAGKPGTLLT